MQTHTVRTHCLSEQFAFCRVVAIRDPQLVHKKIMHCILPCTHEAPMRTNTVHTVSGTNTHFCSVVAIRDPQIVHQKIMHCILSCTRGSYAKSDSAPALR